MRSQVPWKIVLVAGLSLGIGWGAGRSLYSQNADAKPEAAVADAPAVEAAVEPLDELAWLAGNWIEDGETPSVEFTCRWNRTGAFLLRAFRAAVGEETHGGLQLIGWDPAARQIRSWTFDANGGFGEEHWTKSGENWSIRSNYTLADGGKAGAVHVLTKIDDNTFEWRSVSREIDGQMQPDIAPLTIVRMEESAVEAPPPPGGAPAPVVPAKPAPAKR